jgi:hypothetical protein
MMQEDVIAVAGSMRLQEPIETAGAARANPLEWGDQTL